MRFTRAILSSMAGMNAWPPKPGLTVMTRIRSSRSSTYSIALSGVAGIDRHARLFAERADLLQRAVEMPCRLGVDRDVIAARLGEGFEVGIAGLDHQVAVERLVGQGPQRRDDRGPKGDVGHEMPVHHVEMDPVRARRGDGAHFLAELGEIGRQDRRRHDHWIGHAPISLSTAGRTRRYRWSPTGRESIRARSHEIQT